MCTELYVQMYMYVCKFSRLSTGIYMYHEIGIYNLF